MYCVIKYRVDHAPKRYLHTRTRLRLWLSKASTNQFMSAAFFKSVALRTKVPFHKSEVITLQVQFAGQFGAIDVTLCLRSDQHSRAPFTTFGLNYECNVHHDSMLLIINMDVAKGHMSYAKHLQIKETVVFLHVHTDNSNNLASVLIFI